MRAILLSGGLALVFTLVGTVGAIRLLSAKGYGQLIRDDGPTTHHTKRGTPTMGGTVIIGSVVLAYLLSALLTSRVPTASGLLLLFLLVGLGPRRASSTTTSRSPSSAASACAAARR